MRYWPRRSTTVYDGFIASLFVLEWAAANLRFLSRNGRTFTKEIFSLTILLAASADTDSHAVMIAWALVEGESETSGDGPLHSSALRFRHTVTSDRDKGLRATDDEIPLANCAFYVEHISRNIQKNYGVPS